MREWFWWLVGAVGFSGVLLIGAILVFGWPVIVGTKIGRALLAAGTAGVGLLLLYFKARREGAAAEKARQERADEKFVEKDRRSDADIERASDDELDRMLREREQPRR